MPEPKENESPTSPNQKDFRGELVMIPLVGLALALLVRNMKKRRG